MHSPLFRLSSLVASAMLLTVLALPAQEVAVTSSPVSVVPNLIKYSGALPGASNKAETVEVKFSLYAAQSGGEALWSETQQVSLDATGKYSVLLGSVSSLPSSAFASGQARWIGVAISGEQESARTVLVATPYSLKASDAETLAGHPVSDFTLKNALPASGTNITQINVGNGVTGGGTGPTVTLGLSSTYLENLGNEIYPQLGGTNTLTGKNTFTAGKLLLGTSPVLSAANVTGTSPVTATVSGNTVKIGLSDSALLTLGDEVYPRLSTSNTFSGPSGSLGFLNTMTNTTTSVGGGLEAIAVTVGLAGEATATTVNTNDGFQVGVEGATEAAGYGSFGVAGSARRGGGAAGVYGQVANASITGATYEPQLGGAGVWGDSNQGSNIFGAGVLGSADDQAGGFFINNSTLSYSLTTSNFAQGGETFEAFNGYTRTSCTIDGSSDLTCDGTISGSNLTADQHRIETYTVQSSENWIEDFGTTQLSSGSSHVTIDPAFAATVNTGVDYHVFLTPGGESGQIYFANKTSTGFDVREAGGGHSNIAVDYRIVAKRRGQETVRLADVTARHDNTGWPALLKQGKAVPRQPRPLPSAANHFGLSSTAAPVAHPAQK